MKERIVNIEKRLCPCCMEEHDVKVVCYDETTLFNDVAVTYEATSFYCDAADEYYDDEKFLSATDINMKDAYRKQAGLLTSKEIAAIREKYGISQSDFSSVLGWGKKTITRYETHQIQDKAHDSILKRINNDPEWFREFLIESKDLLSEKTYEKYLEKINSEFIKQKDSYRRKTIEAKYAEFNRLSDLNGHVLLSLDKVVEIIRYFAAKIDNLCKTKLMKLIWYSDALSVKENGFAITGLVYVAKQWGALPIEHDEIIWLEGVPCEEIQYPELYSGYNFKLDELGECKNLSDAEMKILDTVIEKLGNMTKSEIVEFMHKEQAYNNTDLGEYISFKYAKDLLI